MPVYPSGQRGAAVNRLSLISGVRISPLAPPRSPCTSRRLPGRTGATVTGKVRPASSDDPGAVVGANGKGAAGCAPLAQLAEHRTSR